MCRKRRLSRVPQNLFEGFSFASERYQPGPTTVQLISTCFACFANSYIGQLAVSYLIAGFAAFLLATTPTLTASFISATLWTVVLVMFAISVRQVS